MSDERYPRTVRRKPRRPLWQKQLAVTVLALAIMGTEAHYRPDPGVGFAIAFWLLVGAALLGVDRDG